MERFGISQPVLRREDDRLLRGRGLFIDDHTPKGVAHGHVVRSPHAHASIAGIDTADARAAPGVLSVVTAADLDAAGVGPIPCLVQPAREGTPFHARPQPALAGDRVRFVGEPVAFVVAETPAQAHDAAELVFVDYAPLPAVADIATARAEGAPPVWDDVADNRAFEWEMGDGEATDAAFAAAARIVRLQVVNNRIVQSAMEARGAIGWWDGATGAFAMETTTQMPHNIRNQLAEKVFAMDPSAVRVLVHDVGGGFGGKNSLYPEQILVLFAARALGRPVKWVGSREEAFTGDYHGRDNLNTGELAVDADGRFLAIRIRTTVNLGAYAANRGAVSPTYGARMASNTYRIPTLQVLVDGVYSNTVPTDVYRGAGRPEITYLIERLVDFAAAETGIDRTELRRRNCIPLEAFPYKTITGLDYEPCDFVGIMEAAMARADWAGFEDRRRIAAERGKLRGIGMANYVERCGGGAGLSEDARLEFQADGSVTLYIGTMSNGQGHETAYSQIVNERFGLPFDKIRVVQGDTDRVASGGGTGGSWSIPMGGGAVSVTADRILDKARRIAAHKLETAEADLDFEDGAFRVTGTDIALDLDAVARLAFDPAALPEGLAPGLDETANFKPENYTYPYGCHVCEVEIDRDTGVVEIVAYHPVHDYGRALNPLLLAGQVHGGVTQGIGQALYEHTVYDDEGQLLTASFMDYCLPHADQTPEFHFEHWASPTQSNPLGIKGCGESGATGGPPAVMNAVVDALKPMGIAHIDMPATPRRVWEAMRASGKD